MRFVVTRAFELWVYATSYNATGGRPHNFPLICQVSSDYMRLFSTDTLEFKTIEHLNLESKEVSPKRFAIMVRLVKSRLAAKPNVSSIGYPNLLVDKSLAEAGRIRPYPSPWSQPILALSRHSLMIHGCRWFGNASEIDRGAYNKYLRLHLNRWGSRGASIEANVLGPLAGWHSVQTFGGSRSIDGMVVIILCLVF